MGGRNKLVTGGVTTRTAVGSSDVLWYTAQPNQTHPRICFARLRLLELGDTDND